MDNLEFLRKKIKFLRKTNKITQRKMCEYLGVTQNTYSDYELGKIKMPVEIIIKIADYFNVSIDYLLNRTECESIIYSNEYFDENNNKIAKVYIK